ncbi:MAG: hypothetical protein QM770_18760 [Tepidisphaeraceae bacterium]
MSQELKWWLRGSFDEANVEVRWIESSRRIVPEVDRAIEEAWQRVTARPDVRLFDGPVGRCESFAIHDGRLEIALSRSSYRIVVGTNFENPHLADTFGPDVMANPMGVSAGVLSVDGLLVLGKRNHRVAYYPNRVHPFAGSLEVRDEINLFDDVRRELAEELRLTPADLQSMELVGIAEDLRMRHPETIYLVRTTRTASDLRRLMDPEEHRDLWTIPLPRAGDALNDPSLTPFAVAVVQACLGTSIRAGV